MGIAFTKLGFMVAVSAFVFFKFVSIMGGIDDALEAQKAMAIKPVPLSHYTEQYLPKSR